MSEMVTGTPVSKSLKEHFKSWRTWVVVMLVFMSVTVWHALSSTSDENHLSPNSYAPNGTRAFFRVLEQQGGTIKYFHNTHEVPVADQDTTVVIIGTAWTYQRHLEEIFENSSAAKRIVFINVSQGDLKNMGIDAFKVPHKFETDVLTKGTCPIDIFGKIKEVSATNHVFDPFVHRPPVQCFLTEGASPIGIWPANSITTNAGKVLRHPQLVGFADGYWFTNRRTLSYHNGALGITVINQTPKINVFYVDFKDPIDDKVLQKPEKEIETFFPIWLTPVYYLLFSAMLFVVFVRRRRFGRLAYEQLPITVKSSETIRSLGRLYEQNQTNTHTAHLLQVDAIKRLRKALYLNSHNSDMDLLNLLANRTNQDISVLQRLLFQPFHGSTAELTRFSKQLDALIQEVTNV